MQDVDSQFRAIDRNVKRRVRADLATNIRDMAMHEGSFLEDPWVPDALSRYAEMVVERARRRAKSIYAAVRSEWRAKGWRETAQFFDTMFEQYIHEEFADNYKLADRTFNRIEIQIERSRARSSARKLKQLAELEICRRRVTAELSYRRRGWEAKIVVLKRELRSNETNHQSEKAKRKQAFQRFAGRLWIDAQKETLNARRGGRTQGFPRVNEFQLRKIAEKLDGEGFVPPRLFLKKKVARALARTNPEAGGVRPGAISPSFPEGKAPAVLYWIDIVSGSDQTLIDAMREALQRAAEFLRKQ